MRRSTLWRNTDFVRLWTGSSISVLGTEVSQLAIPWIAAVVLHASPLAFSLLGVVGVVPFVLFALPAGVWVDRLRRRPLMIAADAIRAVLLASIPITYAFGVLSYPQLLATDFLAGTCAVFFDLAYISYLPSIVDRGHLVDGNAKLELSFSFAKVAGPGLSGALISALTAPYAIVADAISYVASFAFVSSIRHREPAPQADSSRPAASMLSEAKDGLRFLIGHPWLRAIAMTTGIANFFYALIWAVLLLFFTRTLGLSSLQVGAIFALGAGGSVLAALVARALQARIGVGGTLILCALTTWSLLAYPLTPNEYPLPTLIVATVLVNFGIVGYNIMQRSLRQSITPDRLLGRTNAAMRWLVWSAMPVGTLLGGAIATAYGIRAALWVGAIGMTFAVLPLLASPIRTVDEMPTGVEVLEPVHPPEPGLEV